MRIWESPAIRTLFPFRHCSASLGSSLGSLQARGNHVSPTQKPRLSRRAEGPQGAYREGGPVRRGSYRLPLRPHCPCHCHCRCHCCPAGAGRHLNGAFEHLGVKGEAPDVFGRLFGKEIGSVCVQEAQEEGVGSC